MIIPLIQKRHKNVLAITEVPSEGRYFGEDENFPHNHLQTVVTITETGKEVFHHPPKYKGRTQQMNGQALFVTIKNIVQSKMIIPHNHLWYLENAADPKVSGMWGE